MNADNMTPCDWDTLLVNFAAELANDAYRVALQHGMAGSWVDLELDLWKVLAERVQEWGVTCAARWQSRGRKKSPGRPRRVQSL